MRLLFKSFTGNNIFIEVSDLDTFGSLKQKITEKIKEISADNNNNYINGFIIITHGQNITERLPNETLIKDMSNIFITADPYQGYIMPIVVPTLFFANNFSPTTTTASPPNQKSNCSIS